MANVDISRMYGRHKKRDVSVAAYYISEAEIAKLIASGDAAATDDFQLGKLPNNILILASTTTVLVPFTAALSTIRCGIAGGSEFANDVALDAAADTVTAGSGDISSQPEVIVDCDFANAASFDSTSLGKAVVTVEYIEHEQCTGELTNFVA